MKNSIIIDKNGEPLWQNAFEKLAKIKELIVPELEIIKKRWEFNEKSDYPRKLNFNASIMQTLFIACNKFKKIPYNFAINVDSEIFSEYVGAYMELLQYIKQFYPDFVGSKASFTSFVGISASAYSTLLTTSNDPNMLAEIEILNDNLCELEIVSAQSGISKEKSTETKLRADNIGYGLNLKPDISSITINNSVRLDKESIGRKLESMFGSKLLENKKK